MSREDAQMKIRLAPELRDRVVAAAKANNRTLNAEVTARLEMSFDLEKDGPKIVSALNTAIDRADAFQHMLNTVNDLKLMIAAWRAANPEE